MAKCALAAGALILLLGIAGCSSSAGTPSAVVIASATPSAFASSSVSPATPSDSRFSDFVSALSALGDGSTPKSDDVVKALTGANFEGDAIEVTSDRTPTALNADTVSVAFRYDDTTCFLGQYVDGGFYSEIAAPVNGSCLVGEVETG